MYAYLPALVWFGCLIGFLVLGCRFVCFADLVVLLICGSVLFCEGAGCGIVVLMFGDCGGLIVVWVAFIVLGIVVSVVG